MGRTILVRIPESMPLEVRRTDLNPSRWKSWTTISIGVSKFNVIGVYPLPISQIVVQREERGHTWSIQGLKLTQHGKLSLGVLNAVPSAKLFD